MSVESIAAFRVRVSEWLSIHQPACAAMAESELRPLHASFMASSRSQADFDALARLFFGRLEIAWASDFAVARPRLLPQLIRAGSRPETSCVRSFAPGLGISLALDQHESLRHLLRAEVESWQQPIRYVGES